MAASVYATPPPDLSGEDTALSDASNSSQTNSSNHSQSKKRTLSATSTPNSCSTTTTTTGITSFLDGTPDLSKKRRKQTTPIRISASNGGVIETPVEGDDQQSEKTEIIIKTDEIQSSLSQLLQASTTEKTELLQELKQMKEEENEITDDKKINVDPTLVIAKPKSLEINVELNSEEVKLIKQRESEIPKLNNITIDEPPKSPENLKKEHITIPEWDGEIKRKFPTKPEEWLQLAGLPFPFSPEAAAALQASGYLSQLPMLGVPPVPTFTASDGSTRPANIPPRIFNPEAYCDLCNKEFCNKYFLKTHKANKHGIYEPPVSNADMASLSQMGQIQQMSQLLQLQQRQQEQAMNQANNELNQQTTPPGAPLTAQSIMSVEPTVYCDICFKKFSNIFAMRKHRSKVHETPVNGDASSTSKLIDNKDDIDSEDAVNGVKLPDGFRQDYSVEQEDVSFTPQPRKLSPISIQQAREANFSFDKLKRLGVINPEAFCELCGKEYCNKYFLRTHKLKRHGILLPPEDITNTSNKDETQQIPRPERPPWHHIQTSPLNLIVGGVDPGASINRPIDDDYSESSISPKEKQVKQEASNTDDEKSSQPRTPPQQDSEAISVDLQKLQSMIQQLNELNNVHRAVQCTICGKELENRYMLHAHMISEHSGLVDNNNGIKSSQESSPIPIGGELEICKHCEKEFSNIFMLKQHIIDVHGMQVGSSPLREGFITPERPMVTLSLPTTPGPNDRRQPYTLTPTSSYCEICNKELCNKYFMKTHMQRMHGIEIESGAQIGGVVCNVCNKELCSKYFLRVHKHNTHGIVDEGSPLPPNARTNGDSLDIEGSYSQDANLKPGEVSDMSNRYFSHFTEVCPLCSRRFRSAKWLKAHLMSDHGKAGTDKLKELETKMALNKPPSPTIKIPNGAFGLPSPDQNLLSKTALSGLFTTDNVPSSSQSVKGYQCSFCSFSTPILPFLFIHERSHQTINLTSPQNQSEQAVSLAKDQPQQQPQRASQPTPIASSSETPNSTPASTPVPLGAQEPMPVLGKLPIEPSNILNEMANLSQRPAVYAFPQEAGPFIMQSFLVEESNGTTNTDNKHNNNSQGNKKFVPVVVLLPVKERILSPINVSFTLTPA